MGDSERSCQLLNLSPSKIPNKITKIFPNPQYPTSLRRWVDFSLVFYELILNFWLKILCFGGNLFRTEAFYTLVEEVVSRIREKDQITTDKWISTEEAMDLLHVASKSTMQKLRNEGVIRFSQPNKKIILYDRDSILQYIDAHANETF